MRKRSVTQSFFVFLVLIVLTALFVRPKGAE